MAFSFLREWWRRLYSAPEPNLRVVFYTRTGCHLCDDAWQMLQLARQSYDFSLDSVDVDARPELADHFGTQVPVVEVNGRVRFWGRINPVLLDRLFRAQAKRKQN